jgi:hypothetical protein
MISISELLGFFDEKSAGSTGHASAIVAIAGEDLGAALVAHYLRAHDAIVDILPDTCTQGTRAGCRLDRWIAVRRGGEEILYQTEIKNWSAHAIGGRRLASKPSSEELARHRTQRWEREWNGAGFRKPQVAKVLTPMRAPRPSAKVEPLVCFWDAMNPTGAVDPWFTVPVSAGRFDQVSIFSMSGYLRTFSEPIIALDLPDLEARRSWLRRLFPTLDAV